MYPGTPIALSILRLEQADYVETQGIQQKNSMHAFAPGLCPTAQPNLLPIIEILLVPRQSQPRLLDARPFRIGYISRSLKMTCYRVILEANRNARFSMGDLNRGNYTYALVMRYT